MCKVYSFGDGCLTLIKNVSKMRLFCVDIVQEKELSTRKNDGHNQSELKNYNITYFLD